MGHLRHSRFVGLREDKEISEVVREGENITQSFLIGVEITFRENLNCLLAL